MAIKVRTINRDDGNPVIFDINPLTGLKIVGLEQGVDPVIGVGFDRNGKTLVAAGGPANSVTIYNTALAVEATVTVPANAWDADGDWDSDNIYVACTGGLYCYTQAGVQLYSFAQIGQSVTRVAVSGNYVFCLNATTGVIYRRNKDLTVVDSFAGGIEGVQTIAADYANNMYLATPTGITKADEEGNTLLTLALTDIYGLSWDRHNNWLWVGRLNGAALQIKVYTEALQLVSTFDSDAPINGISNTDFDIAIYGIPQTISGEEEEQMVGSFDRTVTISDTDYNDVGTEVILKGLNRYVSFEVTNTGHVLTDFKVQIKFDENAAFVDYISGSQWADTLDRLKHVSATPATMASGAVVSLVIDVYKAYSIKFLAKIASSTTIVIVRGIF